MQRRTVLGAAAALAGLAGCLTPPLADESPEGSANGEAPDGPGDAGEGSDGTEEEPPLPDVVSDEGEPDVDAIGERTLGVLRNDSYVWDLALRLVEAEGTLEEGFSIAVDREREHARAITTQNAPEGPTLRQDSFRTAAGGFERFQQGEKEPEYRAVEEGFADFVEGYVAGSYTRLVAPSLAAHEFGPVEWDREEGAFVAPVTGAREAGAGSAGELAVDPDGVLVGLSVRGVETENGELELDVGLSGIGGTSVEEPGWVEEAGAATG